MSAKQILRRAGIALVFAGAGRYYLGLAERWVVPQEERTPYVLPVPYEPPAERSGTIPEQRLEDILAEAAYVP